MLVLSNSLTQAADEGSLKLATSIVKRMKRHDSETCIVSFEREFSQSDAHLKLNKFHISGQLISMINRLKQPVLYIPFPAPMFSTALRIWILSLFARYGFKVMMIRQYPMSRWAQLLLKLSGAELVVFSGDACEFYRPMVGDRIKYLKTGVDTGKFVPVSAAKKRELKIKYGLDPEKPLVLHVGHMKEGRNIAELMKIDDRYQVLLVVSTLSRERQNDELRQKLRERCNIRVIDSYLHDIEEVYQMCDVYFFPVRQLGHCIDVPLSCLEAAACNKPVVTTDYGEMKAFAGKDGFVFIDNFEAENINELIGQVLKLTDCDTRTSVLDYDWDRSIAEL